MQLSDTVAVITGGASGLGRATAERIVAGGGAVCLLDRDGSPGEEVVKALGENAIYSPSDVTNEDLVQKTIDETIAKFGKVTACVNCAGVGAAMRIIDKEGKPMPLDVYKMVIEINLVGTFNVSRIAAGAMSKNTPNDEGERGVIVNTASAAAFDGQIGQVAYSASKGGVVGMTLPMARDLSKAGIRVCTIAPGTMDTPMLAMLPEPARQALEANIPFPSRLGKASEFAQLACSIIENSYLNAETIRLDGALRMPPR